MEVENKEKERVVDNKTDKLVTLNKDEPTESGTCVKLCMLDNY